MRKRDDETPRSDSEKTLPAINVLYVSPDGSIEDMRSIMMKTFIEDLIGNDRSTLLRRRMLKVYLEDSFVEGDEELIDEIVQGICGRTDWVREDALEPSYSPV